MSLQLPQASFPAKGSAQVAGVRAKIALKPGRSLMDWIRLGKTKPDLAGTGGKLLRVTPEELAKHSTVEDCWIVVRGLVYNITPYMEYHPGGVDELMRGAGIDGTALFDEVHKWVNVESMLEKCFVGKLVEGQQTQKGNVASKNSSLSVPIQQSGTLQNGLPKASGDDQMGPPVFVVPTISNKPRYEWFQSDTTLTIVIYSKSGKIKPEDVIIDRESRNLLITLLVNTFTYSVHLDLENDISNEYKVKVQNSGKVDVILHKSTAGQWKSLGKTLEKNSSYSKTAGLETSYRKCKFEMKEIITHDTNLYRVEVPAGCRMCVPVGHHVHVKSHIEGMEISRSYTVVPPSLISETEDSDVTEGRAFYLMIKIYPDGALSQVIGNLPQGETLEVSSHEGDFKISQLERCRNLVMFAAGTGFTPMARLIRAALTTYLNPERNLHLVFFNKKERDILWREQLLKLQEFNKSFKVTHVLSDAESSWTGLKGRIRKEITDQFLSETKNNENLLICACGPTPFTKEAVRLVKEESVATDMIHAFLG